MNYRIEEIIEKEGVYVSTTSGVSMYPMLRDRRDTIIITPCQGRLKKYDVPLYRRGNRYVLHRILEVRPDSYVIRGDNCRKKEYGITDAQIIGVLTGFYRGNRKIDMNGAAYRLYSRMWPALFPVRNLFWMTKDVLRKFLKKQHPNEKKTIETVAGELREKQEQMQRTGRYLIQLLRAALRDEKAPEKPEDVKWEEVYRLAGRSSVLGLAAYGVETVENLPEEYIWKKWKNEPMKTVHRILQFDVEREEIFAQMKEAGLSYLPLKGIHLAACYPKAGMRTMADNDILYGFIEKTQEKVYKLRGASEEEQQTTILQAKNVMDRIMKQRGFRVVSGHVHDEYVKEPIFNFEMHKRLAAANSEFAEYYKNPWQYVIQDEADSNSFRFPDEDEYIYFLVHAYKHFSQGGCGIRLLTDTWVFREKKAGDMDWDYVKKQLEKINLLSFEEQVTQAASALFGDEEVPLSEEVLELVYFLLHCGTYGLISNSVKKRMQTAGVDAKEYRIADRIRYIWGRLFPEDSWWEVGYPLGYKYKFLRPFITAFRIGRGVIKYGNRLKTEWNVVWKK